MPSIASHISSYDGIFGLRKTLSRKLRSIVTLGNCPLCDLKPVELTEERRHVLGSPGREDESSGSTEHRLQLAYLDGRSEVRREIILTEGLA